MKRVFAVLLVCVLVLSLSACARIKQVSENNTQTGSLPTQEEIETEAPTEPSAILPGNYIQKTAFKFSFERASLYDEVGDNEFLTQKPDEGKRFLICFFEVENVSTEDQYVNPLYISAYLDDFDLGTEILLSDVDGYSSLGGDLSPGKKTKGFVCFQVKDGWQKLEFTYKDGFYKTETYDFIVTPNDIT